MNSLTRLSLAPALLLCLMLGACGSTPHSNYYRLSAVSDGGSGVTPAIGIGPVEIPQYLNRNSMVFMRDDNQLHIASFERWAEPLQAGITRVLGLNLAGALDTQNIRPFPWRGSDIPDYGVQLWLLALDAKPGGTRLVAAWRVYKPASGGEVMRRIGRYQGAGSDIDGAAISSAFSRMLAQLSDDIASAIREDMTGNE
ncbi:MAG: membrane integrity-associated transporter subunit PqiC [Parahaliea sp.]